MASTETRVPQRGARAINRGAGAAALLAALTLVIYLASNPNATQWAAGFLGGLVAVALLAATVPSRLLRMSLLTFVAVSSATFGFATPSWLGLVLALIALTAVVGIVEAAIGRALRVTECFGMAIGALAGLAMVVALFWLASP